MRTKLNRYQKKDISSSAFIPTKNPLRISDIFFPILVKSRHMPGSLVTVGKLLVTIFTLIHKCIGEVLDFNVPEKIEFLGTLFVAQGALVHLELLVEDCILLHNFIRAVLKIT